MKQRIFLVGARNVKAIRIFDVADQSKQRVLPQHDFSVPQVHITPASSRFMTGHLETIDSKYYFIVLFYSILLESTVYVKGSEKICMTA